MVELHPGIDVRIEGVRGCGTRKKGGTYIVSGAPAGTCGKLPVPLDRLNVCPHCGKPLPKDFGGLKPSRAPKMIMEPELLWRDIPCEGAGEKCLNCPLSNAYETGPAVLIWVGEQFYPKPEDFIRESREMGISRRIPAVPKDFVLGETFVLLAHTKACPRPVDREENGQIAMIPRFEYDPGVFSIFRPTAIERIVDGTESSEEIEALLKRGITPVYIKNSGDLPEGKDDSEEIAGE
jgi:hypothetical protein